MSTIRTTILAATIVSAPLVSAGPVSAQDQSDRTVEQYACKEVMRETGSNREVAIAFLHGFLVGKSGSSKFNIDALHKQTDAFIDRCLENPAEKAIDAMMNVKS
jgi:HdeA/HdeB family protein